MNNKGIGVIELLIMAAIAAALTFAIMKNVGAAEIQDDLEFVKLTCYCPESCPGTVTASGARVREGIIASSREHLGDGAMIYLMDGTFLGSLQSRLKIISTLTTE